MQNIPRVMQAADRTADLLKGIESCYAMGVIPRVLVNNADRQGFINVFHDRTDDLITDPIPSYRPREESVNRESQFRLIENVIAHRVRHLGVDLATLHVQSEPHDVQAVKQAAIIAQKINGYLELACILCREYGRGEPSVRERILEEVFDDLQLTFLDAHITSGEDDDAFRARVEGTPIESKVITLMRDRGMLLDANVQAHDGVVPELADR